MPNATLSRVEGLLACWCGGNCPHLSRARALEAQRRPIEAERELHRILADAPDCPAAHSALARVLASDVRAGFGLAHVERAIAAVGESDVLLRQKADLLIQATKIPAAIEAARRATFDTPDDPHAWGALLEALFSNGDLVEAHEILGQCDLRFPSRPRAYRRVASQILDELGHADRALERLKGDDLSPIEMFDRGRLYEKQKRYAIAWGDWMRAQAMMREQGSLYNEAQHARLAADLYEMASPSRRKYLAGAEPLKGSMPIFVCGFPRSGTTMIEAVLAAHPKIVAGDELPFLFEMTQRAGPLLRAGVAYPKALMASSHAENEGAMTLLRDFYMMRARAKIGYAAKARLFTDKMPTAEKHLLLIALLFPASPIVRLERHPLDVLVSNMSYRITHDGYASCAPLTFARHFERIDALCAYTRETLPASRFLELNYERFVADHVDQVDALLAHVGVKPDPQCYEFHATPWRSRTISHRQIKQKVYASSVKRYEPFLEFIGDDVLETLKPAIARHGYSV